MRRFWYIFLAVFFLGNSSAFAAERLVVAGTGDSQNLLRKIAKRYEKMYTGEEVEVPDSVGSGGGIKALVKGEVGLARTARPLKDKEKSGLVEKLFAKSPVVFATHSSVNQVAGLSAAEVLGIYTGVIKNWQEVGGPDAKIYSLRREEGDSSLKVLNKTLPGFQELEGKTKAKTAFSTPEMAEMIRKNRFTIGYLPLSMAKANNLHVLSVAGKLPSAKDIGYPHLTPFYLIHPENVSPVAGKFLDFVFTDAAAEVMLADGVIPQK